MPEAWEEIWPTYVMMSRSRSREGIVGVVEFRPLIRYLDPWVGVRAES